MAMGKYLILPGPREAWGAGNIPVVWNWIKLKYGQVPPQKHRTTLPSDSNLTKLFFFLGSAS